MGSPQALGLGVGGERLGAASTGVDGRLGLTVAVAVAMERVAEVPFRGRAAGCELGAALVPLLLDECLKISPAIWIRALEAVLSVRTLGRGVVHLPFRQLREREDVDQNGIGVGGSPGTA